MGAVNACRPVVMVVDDDESIHHALQLALEDEFEMLSVFDGPTALREVTQRDVSVVLLDLVMPGMDGWETFERLRRMGALRPKIVFLTGVDSAVAAVAAIKLGAEDWIIKPFEESALLGHLRAICGDLRPIIIRGGSLGSRAAIGTIAALRCGTPVRYADETTYSPQAHDVVLDAGEAVTESGISALLRRPPIDLSPLNPAIPPAVRYVSGRYPTLCVTDLARAVGVSATHLVTTFRSQLGVTPRSYLARVRVEVIKQRLEQAGSPGLERLAEEVGLCDAAHLHRLFVRHTGEAPGAYRGRIQKNC